MRPLRAIPTAYTAEPARSAALFILGRRWLGQADSAADAEARSTEGAGAALEEVAASTEEVVASAVVVTVAETV